VRDELVEPDAASDSQYYLLEEEGDLGPPAAEPAPMEEDGDATP